MGAPCWQYGQLKEKNGTLDLTAIYRNQDFFQKALGNYIALGQLLQFMSSRCIGVKNREAGLPFDTRILLKAQIRTEPANDTMTGSKVATFELLVVEANACTLCTRMASSRKVLSYANGSINAQLMFIGEAPGRLGADDTGIPFHGDAAGANFRGFAAVCLHRPWEHICD